MRKLHKTLGCKTLLIGISAMAFTFPCHAQLSTYMDSIYVNNVAALLHVVGDNFDDIANSQSGFEVPKNSNKHTIYASALWIGGYENNNLKTAAMTYRQSGLDFFPGPLDTINAQTTKAEMTKWDKIWKVKKSEIDDFKANHTLYASIANWPGNTNDSTHEAHNMAPYVDVNHNGIYDPANGDYPDIKGDEMDWCVFNDNGGTHLESKGGQASLEIQSSAYEFNSSVDAINNTLFIDYKITNRSKYDLTNAFIGIWTDFDIGYAFDDYIGSAPKLSAYYGYNGTKFDEVYGSNTPIESVIFLKDSMSRFLYYNNDANPVNGNMTISQDYYNYLSGVWKKRGLHEIWEGWCIRYYLL